MATVQNIIDRAVERSNLNDASLISETEAIAYISNLEQNLYLEAARENPDYFGREGQSSTRTSSTATWDIDFAPGNVAAVSRVEVYAVTGSPTSVSVGDEVNIVSIRNPQHGIVPRAYLRNRIIYEYDSELQDDASNYVTVLKVWYSYLPSRLTSTAETVSLPDEHVPMLEIGLAKLYALRDQRPDEVPALDAEYAMYYRTFLQAVSTFDEVTIRELADVPAAGFRLGGG
jgi:hypothetical protein